MPTDGEDVACESVLRDRSLVAGEPLVAAHFDLFPTSRAAGQARRLVAAALAGPSAPRSAAAVGDTAELLVSELVTNAVMHARTDLHVGVCGDERTLLVTVTDGHPDAPPDDRAVATLPDGGADYQESGRGIAIIVALASDFGWRHREDGPGKVMWFTLDMTAADE
jgi:anti-sigma regulatory factor (Ser/Thr protein kinase)